MKINHRCNTGATPERTVKVYKLTDENLQTREGFQYVLGVEATAPGVGRICSYGWLHAYEDPLLASFFSPTHIHYFHPRLYRAEGKVGIRDGQIKLGCSKLILIEEIPLPEINIEQRVEIAIRTVMLVYTEPAWTEWAEDWLSGKNRSLEATGAVATWATAWATERIMTRAATEVMNAATWVMNATTEAMKAMRAAAEAMEAAAEAVTEAARSEELNIFAIIKQVVGDKDED